MARNGPISFPLGLITPTIAAIISNGKKLVETKTSPASVMRIAPATSILRRPMRSARVVIHSEMSMSPARVSDIKRPLVFSSNPICVRYSTRMIATSPYANIRANRVMKRSTTSRLATVIAAIGSAVDQPLVDNRDDLRGHIILGTGDRSNDLAAGRDDLDLIFGRADRLGAVRDHEVAKFPLELRKRAEAMVFGLKRKTHNPATAFLRAEHGDDVVGLDQV